MDAIPQADGDSRETTPDLDGPLEQGQDTRRGDQDDTVERLSTTASDRGMDTARTSGTRTNLTSTEQDEAIRFLEARIRRLEFDIECLHQFLDRDLPKGVIRDWNPGVPLDDLKPPRFSAP